MAQIYAACVMGINIIVTKTGLIVCQYTVRRTQYDRLSQQQLSFLFGIELIAGKPRRLKCCPR